MQFVVNFVHQKQQVQKFHIFTTTAILPIILTENLPAKEAPFPLHDLARSLVACAKSCQMKNFVKITKTVPCYCVTVLMFPCVGVWNQSLSLSLSDNVTFGQLKQGQSRLANDWILPRRRSRHWRPRRDGSSGSKKRVHVVRFGVHWEEAALRAHLVVVVSWLLNIIKAWFSWVLMLTVLARTDLAHCSRLPRDVCCCWTPWSPWKIVAPLVALS